MGHIVIEAGANCDSRWGTFRSMGGNLRFPPKIEIYPTGAKRDFATKHDPCLEQQYFLKLSIRG